MNTRRISSLSNRQNSGASSRCPKRFTDSKSSSLLNWPIVRREDLDGVKVYLGDVGWAMVRALGTELLPRVYTETTRAETTKRALDEITSSVRKL
jgi:phosphomannomutase